MATYPSDTQLPSSQVLVDPQVSVSPVGRLLTDVFAGGYSTSPSVTLTRTANVTAYTATAIINTAIAGAVPLSFPNCVRVSGGGGLLQGITILDENNAGTPAQLTLYLFTATPTNGSVNDAAALALANADMPHCLGAFPVSVSTLVNAGAGNAGSRFYQVFPSAVNFTIPSGTTLYGLLAVTNAYTPVSAEVFVITLNIVQL